MVSKNMGKIDTNKKRVDGRCDRLTVDIISSQSLVPSDSPNVVVADGADCSHVQWNPTL